MKKSKLLLTLLMIVALVCSFSFACSKPAKKYTLSFATENTAYGVVSCVDKNGQDVSSGNKYNKGSEFTLTATANTGYVFDGWYLDGAKSSNDNPLTVKLTADVDYTAKFVLDTFALNYSSEDTAKGTVSSSIASGSNVSFGQSVTITATANAGYSFVGWHNGTEIVNTSATYTFDMPANALTLEAQFETNSYKLNYSSESDAKGTVSSSIASGSDVLFGKSVTITATANAGYTFVGWHNGTEIINTSATYTFDMKASAITLEAQFETNSYKLKFSSESTAKGTVSSQTANDSDVLFGQSITLTATANTGYTFKGWHNGTEIVNTSATYTFDMPANALTLEAQFSRNSYKLNYSSESDAKGTVSSSIASGSDVLFGQSVTITATVNTGYTFDGWYKGTQRVSTSATYTFDMSASEITLEAQFTVNTYTLSFSSKDENMGSVKENNGKISGRKVNYADSISLTATEKVGYDFVGWFVDNENVCETPNYTFNMPANDCVIEARFEAEKREVSFYDGYERVHFEKVDYNTPVTLYTYEKDNYNFIGWYTDPTFKTLYDATANVTKDLNLYARTEKSVTMYSVIFVNDNGAELSGVQSIEEGQTVPHLPADPEKEGHTFAGWVIIDEKTGAITDFDREEGINSNLTITASYTVNSYKVTFYIANEKIDENVYETQSVKYMASAIKPTTPTADDYLWVKWVYFNDQDVEFDFDSKIIQDEDVLAIWKEKPAEIRTVKFIDKQSEKLIDEQSVVKGGSATAPADPVKEGYTFVGWDKAFNIIENDLEVYAIFEIKTFTVIFKDSDGSQMGEKQTVEFGNSATAPTDLDKEGYTFVKWDTEFDEVKKDLIVNAVYEVHVFTATFVDGDSKEVLITVDNVEYNTTLSVPITPSKAGYSFINWYADENFENVFNFNQPIKKDTTIYAKFEIIVVEEYQVEFATPNGTLISKQTVIEGNSAIEPNAPVITGYDFVGWDKAFDNVREDITVVAIYKAKKYNVRFFNVDGTVQIGQTIQVEYLKSARSQAPELSLIPTIEGKEFSGWSHNIDSITKDLDVRAVYLTQTRIVFFNDGVSNQLLEVKVEYGACVSIPNTPSKPGSVFAYWYLDDEETPFDFSTPITEEGITLTAKYRKLADMYTVTFYDPNENVYGNIQVVAKNYYAIEPAPYGDEYYWCLKDSDIPFVFETTPITEDIELYAKVLNQ